MEQFDKILAGFNFPPDFQNELRQINANRFEQALAPVKFELSRWRLEINSNWQDIADGFGG